MIRTTSSALLLSLFCSCAVELAPLSLTGVSPRVGSAGGGERVTLTGTGFSDRTTVTIGGRAARVAHVSAESLEVLTPAGVAGLASVEVSNPIQHTSLEAVFTYEKLRFTLTDATERRLEAGPLSGGLSSVGDYEADGDDDVFQAARADGVALTVNTNGSLQQRLLPLPALDVTTADGGHALAFTDAFSVAAADFNSDGVVDLMVGAAGQTRTRFFEGDLTNGFRDATERALPVVFGRGQRLVSADVDGDGDLDVVATASSLETADAAPVTVLLLNDGLGRFIDGTSHFAGPRLAATGVTPGDFDRDGDLDLFFSMANESCRLLLSDGQGGFRLAAPDALPTDSAPHAMQAAAGDLDGDGDLDLYVPTDAQDRVWLNDGTAHFADLTDAHLSPELAAADSARLVDLDLDGALDVLVSEREGRVRFLRNDGAGRFFDYSADVVGNDGATRTLEVLTVDLERDGVVELFVSRGPVARPALFVHTPVNQADADGDGWVDSLDLCSATPTKAQAARAPFGCRSSAECEAALGCSMTVRGGKAYLSCSAALTRDDADDFCTARGGTLAVIEDPDTNDFLSRGLPAPAWVALDDRDVEGQWRQLGQAVGFSRWAPNQPDNAGAAPGEDCGTLQPGGTWNDVPCTVTARTLCEAPRVPVAPLSCDALGTH